MRIVKGKGDYAGGEELGIPGNSGILAGEVKGVQFPCNKLCCASFPTAKQFHGRKRLPVDLAPMADPEDDYNFSLFIYRVQDAVLTLIDPKTLPTWDLAILVSFKLLAVVRSGVF